MMYVLICALVFAVFLFVDLLTKAFAAAPISENGVRGVHQSDYFLGIVKLDYDENSGMALGTFANNATAMIIITALTVVMIVGICILFFTVFRKNKPAQMALAIVEAGAIGNLIDRIYFYAHSGRGYVRDFINVNKVGFIPGYICNVADIFIMVGAFVLVFVILFIGKQAVFPLTKKWRAEAKADDEAKAAAKEASRNRNDKK